MAKTSSKDSKVSTVRTKRLRWGPPKKPRCIALAPCIMAAPMPTSKAIHARLDGMCQRFQKSLKGHRDHLYELMGNVAAIKVLLDKKDRVRRDFIRSLRKQQKETGRSMRSEHKLNLLTELVAQATGAGSRGARQLAVKRGRVIEVLLGNGIAPAEIPAAIRKKRGIERIYSEAIKIASEPEPVESNTSPAEPKSNDHETTFSVRIRASDREALFEKTELGGRLKLEVLRVGKEQSDFKVTKVGILPSENAEKVNEEELAWR
jgi:hypothetical protein